MTSVVVYVDGQLRLVTQDGDERSEQGTLSVPGLPADRAVDVALALAELHSVATSFTASSQPTAPVRAARAVQAPSGLTLNGRPIAATYDVDQYEPPQPLALPEGRGLAKVDGVYLGRAALVIMGVIVAHPGLHPRDIPTHAPGLLPTSAKNAAQQLVRTGFATRRGNTTHARLYPTARARKVLHGDS